MTAKEMFKELGYDSDNLSRSYYWGRECLIYNKFLYGDERKIIIFDFTDKDVEIRCMRDVTWQNPLSNSENTFKTCFVDIDLLKAINKQCKELGGLDE